MNKRRDKFIHYQIKKGYSEPAVCKTLMADTWNISNVKTRVTCPQCIKKLKENGDAK